MTEPLTRTMANALKDINDKVKYAGKKLCKECGNQYHPDQYETCWDCWSKKPANTIKNYAEGYASSKDWTESADPKF